MALAGLLLDALALQQSSAHRGVELTIARTFTTAMLKPSAAPFNGAGAEVRVVEPSAIILYG